jgi:hypothetical protein
MNDVGLFGVINRRTFRLSGQPEEHDIGHGLGLRGRSRGRVSSGPNCLVGGVTRTSTKDSTKLYAVELEAMDLVQVVAFGGVTKMLVRGSNGA